MSLVVTGFGRRRVCVFCVLVRIVLLLVVFFFIFGVRDDYHLAQNLIKLVAAGLFVASPLDEVVQAQRYHGFPGIGIRSLP
jgi:hypothetical protein